MQPKRVTCRHSPPLEIAAAWPWRERRPSKSEVLSARTKMASTSRTALWTGTAGHVERLEQIFDNLGKTEGVCAFPKKLQIRLRFCSRRTVGAELKGPSSEEISGLASAR